MITKSQINLIKQIIICWSLKKQEYQITHCLYTTFNVGIPNRLLYSLPEKNIFYSAKSFLTSKDNPSITSDNKYLNNLLELFRKSKYQRLPEWNNLFGYKLKSN